MFSTTSVCVVYKEILRYIHYSLLTRLTYVASLSRVGTRDNMSVNFVYFAGFQRLHCKIVRLLQYVLFLKPLNSEYLFFLLETFIFYLKFIFELNLKIMLDI